MKIAIFGGSFNPVHNEHIKVAKGAIKELNLDKLIVMPTFISPHKKNTEIISAEHRLNMLKLAFSNEKAVEVSSYEIDKGGISYTFETVTHFKNLYPSAKIYFMLGSDMLENFPTWKNPDVILDNCTLLLTERRTGEFNDDALIDKIYSLYGHRVERLKVYGETISSTKIRTQYKLGLSLDGLVPKSVEDYIVNNSVYESDVYYEYIKKVLPIKRRIHTAGVITTAIDLAKKLNVDVKKAELSALLHDVAKYEDINNYKGAEIKSDLPSDIVHQYLGEYIARTKLNVNDSDVLLAIKYHTTGRANMTMLEKVIYIADLIEPSRKFQGVEKLREEINKDFNVGFKVCLEEIIEFLKLCGKEVYSLTLDALKGEIYE